MRLLEQNFEIIRYIEFNGLAGEYNETIQNKYQVIKNRAVDFLDMSVQEIREYVPEYMNIKKSLEDSKINVTDSAGNVTTVTLAKKNYNNVINISYEL
jgi:alkaline phosphatase